MNLQPMSRTDVESVVKDAIDDAVDFVESEIAADRIKAQRYFDGEVDIGEEDGRSKVVATKIRDVVRAIKPSLMRVFLNTDKAVEFTPRGPEDVAMAEQATKYVHYVFNSLNGFNILSDLFHDALIKKSGIAKVYWEDYQEAESYELTNLNDNELALLVNEEGVEVMEQATEMSIEVDESGMEVQMPRHSVKIQRQVNMGKACIESVPPEEFFVDSNATSLEEAYVVVHRTEMRGGDLVAMGFDFDQVSELSSLQHSDSFAEEEEFERRGHNIDDPENVKDPSMRIVAVSEAYMKMDIDGTGIPQMYKFILGGNKYELLDYEPWGEIPFAVFEVDPEPHTFYGRSLADILFDEQDAATAMLRSVLDNLALTNSPRTEIVDGQVNVDDLLNNEIGGVVRVKQNNTITPLAVPFVAGQTLGAIQYFDEEIQTKTGVSKASMGLSPDAMQSTTATAVQATVSAAAGQVEVMARNLAEGGMKRMFKLLLKLIIENCSDEKMMRVVGTQYQPIDPRSWNAEMDIGVNVGLGTGREDQKMSALMQALQMQMQIIQNYGPMNGIVTITQVRNTLSDLLAINGIRNSDRYFTPMTPETEQMMLQQMQQMQQQQGGAEGQYFVQAEQIKAEAKMRSDQLKLQLEAQKAIAQDDRERDKLDQELLLAVAEYLGKYNVAVDVEKIKQMQAQPRYPAEVPTQAVVGSRF